MTNNWKHTGFIDVGDLDEWNFTANAGDTIALRMGATNLTPWIRLYGPDGTLESATMSGNVRNPNTSTIAYRPNDRP